MLGDGKRDESGPKEHRIRKLPVEKRGIRMQRSVPSSQTRQRRLGPSSIKGSVKKFLSVKIEKFVGKSVKVR